MTFNPAALSFEQPDFKFPSFFGLTCLSTLHQSKLHSLMSPHDDGPMTFFNCWMHFWNETHCFQQTATSRLKSSMSSPGSNSVNVCCRLQNFHQSSLQLWWQDVLHFQAQSSTENFEQIPNLDPKYTCMMYTFLMRTIKQINSTSGFWFIVRASRNEGSIPGERKVTEFNKH